MTQGWSTEFETGLIDDFDFTITNAFFAPDAKYNNGDTLLLQWEGSTDNPDLPTTHCWFPLGKGWASTDGGKSIAHDSGKDRYFNKNSLMAKLITRCVDDFGLQDLLAERGGPFEAVVWNGLTFHMKNVPVEFGKGLDPTTKLMPVAFIGAAGAASAAPSNGTVSQSNGNGNGSTASDAVRNKVVAIFKTAPDFATAQDKVLSSVEGVTDDDALLNSIMDESGLWAEVRS